MLVEMKKGSMLSRAFRSWVTYTLTLLQSSLSYATAMLLVCLLQRSLYHGGRNPGGSATDDALGSWQSNPGLSLWLLDQGGQHSRCLYIKVFDHNHTCPQGEGHTAVRMGVTSGLVMYSPLGTEPRWKEHGAEGLIRILEWPLLTGLTCLSHSVGNTGSEEAESLQRQFPACCWSESHGKSED